MPPSSPLRSRLSEYAPRSAQIISRGPASAAHAPTYNLKVGGVILKDISLDEVFQYVSAQDYETFENACFRREIEAADQRALERSLTKRRPGRPRKHREESGSLEESTEQSSADDEVLLPQPKAEAEVGRYERPRPSYSHLYLKTRGRQARSAGVSRASFKQKQRQERTLSEEASSLSLADGPKRRRLNGSQSGSRSISRTETTGSEPPSSAPASPPAHKELLSPSTARLIAAAPTSANSNRPSLSTGLAALPPDAGAYTSASDRTSSVVSTSSELGDDETHVTQRTIIPEHPQRQRRRPDSSSDSNRPSRRDPRGGPESAPHRAPTSSKSRPTSSTGPPTQPRIPPPTPGSSATLATRAPPTVPAAAPGPAPASDDSDAESATYEIEGILNHHLSDPRTHPPELGKEPVMLFQVKWIGYDEPTWEPIGSFDDEAVVKEYWKRVNAAGKGGKGKGRIH